MRGLPLSGPGSQPAGVENALLDIRRVVGTVKDANNLVQPNVVVRVYARDTDQLVGEVTTAADGTWSVNVNHTPRGYYAIWLPAGLATTTGIMTGPYFT